WLSRLSSRFAAVHPGPPQKFASPTGKAGSAPLRRQPVTTGAATLAVGYESNCNRQPVQAPQHDPPVPFGFAGQFDLREPLDQRADRDLPLEAGQRRAEAVVDAVPE